MASSLKSKVEAKVDIAFAKIDSLLVDAVFTKKSATDFDLVAGLTVETAAAVNTRRVFKMEKIIRSGEGPVKVMQILFRSDGSDYTVYDTVTVDGKIFRIVMAIDDGYTVTAEVVHA